MLVRVRVALRPRHVWPQQHQTAHSRQKPDTTGAPAQPFIPRVAYGVPLCAIVDLRRTPPFRYACADVRCAVAVLAARQRIVPVIAGSAELQLV